MSLLEVLTIPDKRLRQKCLEVEKIDGKIKKLLQDMLQTMYAENGIGLAANQVGILKQIIVIDIAEFDKIKRDKEFYPLFLINPKCTFYSNKKTEFDEGCLSVPGSKIIVSRAEEIQITYTDINNNTQIIKDNGLLARVIQHEMDHLNGKTIIDYASKLKRDFVTKKLSKVSNLSNNVLDVLEQKL